MLPVASLTSQLVTVVVGFLLTTVVGGVLGYIFQRRSWEEQHRRAQEDAERERERTIAEAERERATETFRQISELMDRRLYRMRQLNWASYAQKLDFDRVEQARADYRTVLYDWNDSVNRNLAAAQIEFGPKTRRELEVGIYEDFKSLGARLEARLREIGEVRDAGTDPGSLASQASLEPKLNALASRVYRLNVRMREQIRDGAVGRHAPQ